MCNGGCRRRLGDSGSGDGHSGTMVATAQLQRQQQHNCGGGMAAWWQLSNGGGGGSDCQIY
jgi:hypothetical protein